MKRYLISVLLVLALASPALAGEWGMQSSMIAQQGNYEFTSFENGHATYSFRVAVPLLQAGLELGLPERWAVSAFFSASEECDSSISDAFLAAGHWGEGDPWGRASAWGVDVGRNFELGQVEVRPTAGYRYAQFLAGIQRRDHDYTVIKSLGLQTQGVRLGLQARLGLGAGPSFTLTGGISPAARVTELRQKAPVVGIGRESDLYRWEPVSQSGSTWDVDLSMGWPLGRSWRAVGGYRHESGSFSFDMTRNEATPPAAEPCRADRYDYHAGRLYLGATLTF